VAGSGRLSNDFRMLENDTKLLVNRTRGCPEHMIRLILRGFFAQSAAVLSRRSYSRFVDLPLMHGKYTQPA
jgi:hypothetical protein